MNEARLGSRQEFIDRAIDAIERGQPLPLVPLQRSWTDGISPQNAGSAHEYPHRGANPPIEPERRFLSVMAAMERDGLEFEIGREAFYMPGADLVVTPPVSAFKNIVDYQAVVLHEIGHATGAEHRLGRGCITSPSLHAFGSEGYAREELIAEFFSVFIAMEAGIARPRDEQHAAYLKFWIVAVSDDKAEFFKAADAAAKAVDYVIGKEREMLLAREEAKAEHDMPSL